jgi:hypothetical protein
MAIGVTLQDPIGFSALGIHDRIGRRTVGDDPRRTKDALCPCAIEHGDQRSVVKRRRLQMPAERFGQTPLREAGALASVEEDSAVRPRSVHFKHMLQNATEGFVGQSGLHCQELAIDRIRFWDWE